MKSILYKLAVWYIGKCNAKWNKPTLKLKSLKRLTYRINDKAYLLCGSDAEWRNFSRYDVLDNAIQKLADYEDADIELQKRNADCEVIGPCPYCGRPGYITKCLNHQYITANHKKKCLMKPDTWMISDKSLRKQIKAWNMRWKGKENE